MLSCYSSNAILTKVRAVFGKRLTPADYSQMARKKAVGEVAAFLKENSSYSFALKNVRETEVHRGQVEALLRKDIFYKYASLLRYDFSNNPFYTFILTRIEVEEILRRIVFLVSRIKEDFILDMPTYLLHQTSFDLMVLAKADSFASLLDCLAGTPYQAVLKKMRLQDGKVDYLACEYAMYCFYYKYLFASIEKNFRADTKEALTSILTVDIEMRNVEIIFRLKRFYHLPNEEIKRLLFPYRKKLTEDRINAMLAAETVADMRKASGLFRHQPEKNNSPDDFIELHTQQHRYNFARKQLRFTTKAPVAMYAFLTLRGIEVEDIVTIIEGIRYQASQEEIESLLIL